MNRMGRISGIAALALLLIASPRSSRATDWQPIAPEDLALKDNPKQPGADAMILYRDVVVNASKANVDGDSVEEYVRIKVFTQAGTKEGHVNIEFVKERQTVPYIAGRTIRPDGTIVKFDGQVLETTVEKVSGVKFLAKSFTLPDVQPGCIIEYIFQRQGKPGVVYDHEWQVSQSMYTREAHFSYFPYTGYGSGLLPMYTSYLLPPDTAPKEQINGSYMMVVHDIPGVVEEPLMPPEKPIESRVAFYYQDPGAPSASEASDHYWNYYAKKWDGDLEHFIDKKNALNQELSKIVSPGDSPEVKLRKIYAGVLQIRNLNMEDFKTAKEHKDENLKENSNVEDVLNRRYAYAREVNYLFVGLARAAGFDATEVYVAPRNEELFLPARNEVEQLRADVVWVKAGSQEYYVDPAARYFSFGLLPWYESGTGGIRVDKHTGTVINVTDPVSSDATMVRTADLEVKEDGSISGVIQVDYKGERAGLLREDMRKEDDTERTKDFEDTVKSWLPAGSEFAITKIADWDNVEQPVHLEGTLRIPSFATGAARRLLMPLEIFQMEQTGEFASEKRSNMVYFHFPYEEMDDIKLRVPAGYKVESVPPARNINLGAVSFEIGAAAQGDTVEVKRHLVVKGIIFSKEDYPVLRRFFGTVKTNDNAQMVLQNAATANNN
ncbi:MAG TPA: DUF3857 domain-containing protein [Candidatus Acidoferrales bacterium]|nr:DUF3857 domain-containing protein [Candidatus Acidoferrales bacterium]